MAKKPHIRQIRNFRRLSTPVLDPNTISIHPDLAVHGMQMLVTGIGQTDIVEKEISDPDELLSFLTKYPVTWLSVFGLADAKKLQRITDIFKLHKTALLDVVNVHQRPKAEVYPGFVFSISRMPSLHDNELDLEQVSLFWSKNFVISFNERQCDCYDALRGDIRREISRKYYIQAEYTAYAIIDTIVESYFPVLETYGLKLDDIEEDAIINPTLKIVSEIHDFKRDMAAIRRAAWSQREAVRSVSEIQKADGSELRIYIRDCEDHTIQLIDILESYRERATSLMDIYLAALNNKMNEVMKVLTMIATIFMPINVVAGIYGMNFDRSKHWNMPELGWEFGYLYALGLMFSIAICLILLFKRRGWLRRKDFG